jgi:hypothetical protein
MLDQLTCLSYTYANRQKMDLSGAVGARNSHLLPKRFSKRHQDMSNEIYYFSNLIK